MKAVENSLANQKVSDIQLYDFRDGGNSVNRVKRQSMARMHLKSRSGGNACTLG